MLMITVNSHQNVRMLFLGTTSENSYYSSNEYMSKIFCYEAHATDNGNKIHNFTIIINHTCDAQ